VGHDENAISAMLEFTHDACRRLRTLFPILDQGGAKLSDSAAHTPSLWSSQNDIILIPAALVPLAAVLHWPRLLLSIKNASGLR
jgi:hypothetical protein